MDSAQFWRVQEIFAAALQSSPGEARERLLLAECGNDEPLLREVRSLLAAEQAENLAPPTGTPPLCAHNVVTEGYFQTLGVSLKRGRLFGVEDREGSEPAVGMNLQ